MQDHRFFVEAPGSWFQLNLNISQFRLIVSEQHRYIIYQPPSHMASGVRAQEAPPPQSTIHITFSFQHTLQLSPCFTIIIPQSGFSRIEAVTNQKWVLLVLVGAREWRGPNMDFSICD